eukprot:Skav228061  [mRNA]  locus=scaffold2067:140634:140939:+ [translate_table: standard]
MDAHWTTQQNPWNLLAKKNADEIAAVAQQLKIAATPHACALWFGSGDPVICLGHRECGGDSSGVQDQLQNVQQFCGTSSAFAAILADGNVVTWGDPMSGWR